VATITDDLGAELPRAAPRHRIVSLVPSLTEAVASARRDALIGATDWCTHPADLDVPRVRGTKNPDIAKIIALRPDLVLVNREENRRIDVERLRAAGVQVWVTVIEGVPQALLSLRRLFEFALQWPAPAWLDEAEAEWSRPVRSDGPRVVVPVWRDPWMVVGSRTFTGDVLARLGVHNVFASAGERYPGVELAEVLDASPDVVVLPDEPYVFTTEDGPDAFPGLRCVLIEGRLLTWYGPSLVTARTVLARALAQ
jgi:ABC-type Fe3+-hydroxamate transport system substrate-binding protein